MGIADDELLSQQGENLLRGLARINEDFVFLVTAAFVDRPALTAAMVKMAQVASQVASRQRGSIGAGFSIAVPLAAALSNAYAQNLGHSQSVGHSQADTVSEGWSQSESQSWGHSVGQSQSHGTSHTESSGRDRHRRLLARRLGQHGLGPHRQPGQHRVRRAHRQRQPHRLGRAYRQRQPYRLRLPHR